MLVNLLPWKSSKTFPLITADWSNFLRQHLQMKKRFLALSHGKLIFRSFTTPTPTREISWTSWTRFSWSNDVMNRFYSSRTTSSRFHVVATCTPEPKTNFIVFTVVNIFSVSSPTGCGVLRQFLKFLMLSKLIINWAFRTRASKAKIGVSFCCGD